MTQYANSVLGPNHRAGVDRGDSAPISLVAVIVICALLCLIILPAVVASHLMGANATVVFRDRSAVLGISPFVGVLSNLGVIAMASAASICLFAALLVERDRALLLAIAAFTAMIFVDDLLMLHEHVFPVMLGVPEKLTLSIYVALAVAMGCAFRSAIFRRENFGLAIAIAFLSASVAIDVLYDVVTPVIVVVEDGTKLIGLALWSAFWISTALKAVRPAMR